MEENIEIKIQKNWRKIKEKLTGNHQEVRDQLYENGILDVNDLETVDWIPTPMVKVELMMKQMMHRKQFGLFLNILERIGYGTLCKEIKESGSDLITKPIIHTKIVTKSIEIVDVLNRLAKLEKENTIQFEKSDTNLQEVKNELSKISTAYQQLEVKFGDLENDYEHLQSAYAFARSKIEDLTTRLKEKTIENTQLKKSLDSAQSEIKELKERDVSIKSQEEKLIQLDEQIKKIIQTAEEEKERKECEISNMSERIESLLKRESLNIQGNATVAAGKGKRSRQARWKIPGKY